MYLEHFGLQEMPFRLTPDADFLFLSRVHARAKAYMDYTVFSRDGFVVVTGEIGSGKTTLIHALIGELPEDVVLAKLFQTQLDATDFLRTVLAEFGIERWQAGKAELLATIRDFLLRNHQEGRRVVLVVDEAQNLRPEVIEEIRLLSGMETDKEKLLSIILAGQPEFAEVLDAPNAEQLRQRIRLRFHLEGLDAEETQSYIQHRLRVAGATRDDVFEEEAHPVIYRYSGGIPRLVNSLCDMALLCAYVDGHETVDADGVLAAADELRWQPYWERHRQKRMPEVVKRLTPDVADGGEFSDDRLGLLFRVLSRSSARMLGKMGMLERRLGEIARELRQR